MKKNLFLYFSILMACVLTACEKADFDDESKEDGANLTIRVSNVREVAYNTSTRALVDITGYSSRLNFVIYKNGEQVKSLMQMQGDSGYGEVAFQLMPGTYKVLVLAHSSKGNPSLTDPEQIKFTNSISFSDTFYYYGDVVVTTEAKTHELMLTRASSLLNFIIDDEIPSDAATALVTYTGGCGVFNAVTGYGGTVNSQQEKLYDIKNVSSPVSFKLYTFLPGDEGLLKVTIVVKNDNGDVILERQFTNIPVKRNVITEYSGAFFQHDNSFLFKANTVWADTIRVAY